MKLTRFAPLFIVALIFILGCAQKSPYPVPEIPERTYPSIDLSACPSKSSHCFIGRAISEANPNYCEQIVGEDRPRCFLAAAMRAQDYAVCDNVEKTIDARNCKIVISHDRKNMDACLQFSWPHTPEGLSKGATKGMCENAITGRSGKLGEPMMDIMESTDECDAVAARMKNNQEAYRNQCYLGVAVSQADPDICESLPFPLQYYCLARATAVAE